MRLFLLSLNHRLQIAFIIGFTIFSAFVLATLASLFFDTHQLTTNTDLISSVYEVMGTIYAILLTFTLWGVWQNFTNAATSVENEAFALLDLVHIVESSTLMKATHLRQAVLNYCQLVVEKEWPKLKSITNEIVNHFHEQSRESAMQIVSIVQNIHPGTNRDEVVFGQALRILDTWLDARRARLLIARGNSARALWPLLFTGATVLFSIHGLFVAKTMGIWATLLVGTSLVTAVTFYLIYTLDCPFEGALSVDPEPFLYIQGLLSKATSPDDCVKC